LVDVNRKICRLRPVEQTEGTAQEKRQRRRSIKELPAQQTGSHGLFFQSAATMSRSIWKPSQP